MNYGVCEAIVAINPSARVSVEEEDLDRIKWRENTPVIPRADIIAKMVELKVAYDALEYKRLREPEYPAIAELVVALYDTDDKADIDKRRADVKAKYPKP